MPLWYARWDKAPNFDKWATTDSFGGWQKPYGKQVCVVDLPSCLTHCIVHGRSVCGCQVDENYSPYIGAGAIPFVTAELPCAIGSQSGLCRSEAACNSAAASENKDSQWTDANAHGCEYVMSSIKCCVLTPKPVVTAVPTPRPTSAPTPTTAAPPSTLPTTTPTTAATTTTAPRVLNVDDALVAKGAIWFYRSIPPESTLNSDVDNGQQAQDWQTNPNLGYKTLDGWSLGATPIGI